MGDTLDETVLGYLQSRHVLTLATAGAAGPWAAAVFYVTERFDLIFLSSPNSRHAQNLSVQPRAAAAIHDNVDDWRAVQGIQLEGPVHMLADAPRQKAIGLYLQRFPFLKDAPATLQNAFEHVAWYRIVPDRLYFVDNSRGFGHRDRII